MTVKLIVEAGSIHCGSLEAAKKLIDAAKDIGAWAVKWQLFPDEEEFTKTGNIPLNPWFVGSLVEYGVQLDIPVFFSLFGEKYTDLCNVRDQTHPLADMGVKMIKFPFSQRHEYFKMGSAFRFFETVIVSTSVMDIPDLLNHTYLQKFIKNGRLIILYCHSIHGEPVYPVTEQLDFDPLFTDYGFHGFSSHCINIHQVTRAINAGAEYIEIHVKLDDTPRSACPDAAFAINVSELKRFWD